MKREAKHALFLVLAGVLPGFILAAFSLPFYYAAIFTVIIIILTITFLVYGVGVYDDAIHNRRIRRRWNPPLKVAILRENSNVPFEKESADNYVWTHTPPDKWVELLKDASKAAGVDVYLTYVDIGQDFDDCAAILNPYGGSYPESDLKNLSIMSKITEYVKEGGVFVNVADVPSYWAHNSVLGRKLDVAESVYVPIQSGQSVNVIPTKLFDLTPMAKEFALKMVKVPPVRTSLGPVLGPGSPEAVTERLVVVESNMKNCLSPIQGTYLDGSTKEMTPLCFVHYGNGDALLSLFWLDTAKNTEAQIDAVRRAICRLLIHDISAKSNSTNKRLRDA